MQGLTDLSPGSVSFYSLYYYLSVFAFRYFLGEATN